MRQKQQNLKDRNDEASSKKIDEQCKKLLAKGLELARKYREQIEQLDTANEVKCAFVTFRSEEGRARILQAYQMNRGKRCLVMCCFKEKVRSKLFFERWLQVEPAINPSLIMWQNLGYSQTSRCFRIILTTVVSLVLIIATMFVVLGQSAINTEINQISPQINCLD